MIFGTIQRLMSMAKEKLKNMPVFWGCTFTHNFPFLIDSTKLVLERLGIRAEDVPDAGCCPDPVYLKTQGEDLNLALSARNLALARTLGREMIVACNGCYNVLHDANKKLQEPNVRKKINGLVGDGRDYDGKLKLTHILATLSSKLPEIKGAVTHPLGLKVAVHYGCHSLYPEVAVATDNPKSPTSMDKIVETCGCESIEYNAKHDCCGVSIIAFEMKESNKMLSLKLEGLGKKADCIVTSCPACFMRFDALPPALKSLGVPVIHISELLALAFGVSAKELFFEGHMTDVTPALEKIGKATSELDLVKRNIDPLLLEHHCGACSKECTMAIQTRDSETTFDPLEIVGKLLDGKYKEVIEGNEIWMCLQCGHCEENCPSNSSLIELFARLRELALEDMDAPPRAIADKLKNLKSTGFAMPKKIGVRKKMGIDPHPEIDAKSIEEIIEKIEKGKRKDD
jgi:heterodisulfide reductase subunit B